MAMMLWHLKHNYWRAYKDDEKKFSIQQFLEDLDEMFTDYDIIIDELNE
jgi:hypothetical protein